MRFLVAPVVAAAAVSVVGACTTTTVIQPGGDAGVAASSACDAASDPLDCGACGNALPDGQLCVEGKPTCNDAKATLCDGRCVDTSSDVSNCGACGVTVPTGGSCVAGTVQPDCKPTGTCGAVVCGSVPDGCGGTVQCGICSHTDACTADTCVSGQCVNTPRPELSSCGTDSACSGSVCRALHAKCTAIPPNTLGSYTLWVDPDPQHVSFLTVGNVCQCNGNSLETLFNSNHVPTVTEGCSMCMTQGAHGDVYCFR